MKVKVVILMVGMVLIVLPLKAQDKLVFSSFEHPDEPVITSLTEAYRRIGIQFDIRRVPSARALQLSNSGEVDGEVQRIANMQKRFPNLIMIPVPLFFIEVTVFAKEITFKVDGWNSLKPYKIGRRIGFKLVENNTQGMNTVSVETPDQLFEMLHAGRIDIVITTPVVWARTSKRLKQQLSNFNPQTIKILRPALQITNLYHYLHKKNKSLVSKITTSLQQMEKEGLIKKIADEYITGLMK